MISLIGKLDRKVDWVEMYMERMIGSLGKLGRKVDIGRKMNDPDGALDPWSCFPTRYLLLSISALGLDRDLG